MTYTDDEYNVLVWATHLLGGVSIVADLFVISAMVCLNMLRNPENINSRLVFLLAATDMLRTLGYLLGGDYQYNSEVSNDALCTAQVNRHTFERPTQL